MTILAVLFIIVSVFAFFGAAGAAAQGAILEAVGMSPTAVIITGVLSGILGLAAGVAMLMGRAYMLVIGAVVIYIIISLINPFLQPAAITDPITGQQIDLRGQSLAGSAISILIALVVLFYLTRGHVKAFFQPAPSAMYPPPTAPTPPPPPTAASACPTCGTPLQFVPQYQRYWCPTCRQYR